MIKKESFFVYDNNLYFFLVLLYKICELVGYIKLKIWLLKEMN